MVHYMYPMLLGMGLRTRSLSTIIGVVWLNIFQRNACFSYTVSILSNLFDGLYPSTKYTGLLWLLLDDLVSEA